MLQKSRVLRVISLAAKTIVVGIILTVSFLPFIFVIINSFKTAQSFIFADLEDEWTANNYSLLFSNFDIFKYIINTLIIIAIVVSITMILSYFCAYCLCCLVK
jgi:ABC-type glycerol-3-phosphate transport system permease component